MIRRFFRDGLHWVAIASAIVGAALWFSVPANADPITESAYINALDDGGITYPSRSYAINAGYALCTLLDFGATPNAVALQLASDSYLSIDQSSYTVAAAITLLCPEHYTADMVV